MQASHCSRLFIREEERQDSRLALAGLSPRELLSHLIPRDRAAAAHAIPQPPPARVRSDRLACERHVGERGGEPSRIVEILDEWRDEWVGHQGDGMLTINGDRIELTRQGLLHADALLPAFFEADEMAIGVGGSIVIGENKSWPVVDGRPTDEDALGAALDQAATYVLLGRRSIRDGVLRDQLHRDGDVAEGEVEVDHADVDTLRGQRDAEVHRHGRLAHPGAAGDPESHGMAGRRHHPVEKILRQLGLIWAGALDQGDGPGEGTADGVTRRGGHEDEPRLLRFRECE